MLISHKKKFIFVHLYKTGGTSVRKILERYDTNYSLYHRTKSMLTPNPVLKNTVAHKHAPSKVIREAVGPEIYDNYFSFIFVRNPWDWQVSLYHFVRRDQTNQHHDVISSFQSFEEYIEWRCAEEARFQKDFVIDESGEQIVDFIGRKESINEDFKVICDRVGIPGVDLPHLNKSVDKGYQEFYNTHTKNLVGDTFKPDIEYFNYDF